MAENQEIGVVKFAYTIIYVADVDRALQFYEQAFAMKRRFISDEKNYGELETGATVLAFAAHDLGKANLAGSYVSATDSPQPLGMEIALLTDDVAAAHEQALQHGASELNAPETKVWGQVVSYVRCPSGVLVELCSPIGH